jgi:hypothetical protein
MNSVPASVRPGRVTDLFLNGAEVPRLRFCGRWTNLATLEHYIQESAAALATAHIPKAAQQTMSNILAQVSLFKAPPAAHWTVFYSRDRQQKSAEQWRRHHRKPRSDSVSDA